MSCVLRAFYVAMLVRVSLSVIAKDPVGWKRLLRLEEGMAADSGNATNNTLDALLAFQKEVNDAINAARNLKVNASETSRYLGNPVVALGFQAVRVKNSQVAQANLTGILNGSRVKPDTNTYKMLLTQAFELVATVATSKALKGNASVSVENRNGFVIGDNVTLERGTPREETVSISKIAVENSAKFLTSNEMVNASVNIFTISRPRLGTLYFDKPLKFDHGPNSLLVDDSQTELAKTTFEAEFWMWKDINSSDSKEFAATVQEVKQQLASPITKDVWTRGQFKIEVPKVAYIVDNDVFGEAIRISLLKTMANRYSNINVMVRCLHVGFNKSDRIQDLVGGSAGASSLLQTSFAPPDMRMCNEVIVLFNMSIPYQYRDAFFDNMPKFNFANFLNTLLQNQPPELGNGDVSKARIRDFATVGSDGHVASQVYINENQTKIFSALSPRALATTIARDRLKSGASTDSAIQAACVSTMQSSLQLGVGIKRATHEAMAAISILQAQPRHQLLCRDLLLNYMQEKSGCVDLDKRSAVRDRWGDTCAYYLKVGETECGRHDTTKFKATALCCSCGGGGLTQINDPLTAHSSPWAQQYDFKALDEDKSGHITFKEFEKGAFTNDACIDQDTRGQADTWGDNCKFYTKAGREYCEKQYSTKTFIAKKLCCACGGGLSVR